MSEDRPYTIHRTDGTDEIGAFMQWLQEIGAGDADPVGVEVGENGAALVHREDLYLVSPGEEGQFGRSALAAAIMGGSPPRLTATNAEDVLVKLGRFLAGIYNDRELFGRLAQCMIGDLAGCATTVGYAPAAEGLSTADAAYTARLLEPQYCHEAPAYYTRISLPMAKLQAEWQLFGQEAPATWWVSYPSLWLRVLAHYTADPTLVWMLNEGQEPLTGIARLFEWPPEQTAAVLLWHICGRSVDAMAPIAPQSIEELPDDLPAVGGLWDRRLPSLWAGITGLMSGYQRDRLARTLYGRKLRGGQHPGTASAHTILGTARDIMEVAAVTFWNKRPGPSVMIKHIDSFTIDPVCRVTGVGPQAAEEREQWVETLRHLAVLEAPLGTVSLTPTVVKAPEESPVAQASEESTRSSSGPTDTTPETTTRTQTVGGPTSRGTLKKGRKRPPTKPKASAAAPKRGRATAAAKSCESSQGKSRAKSSKSRKSSG